jgi:hypothetical protein
MSAATESIGPGQRKSPSATGSRVSLCTPTQQFTGEVLAQMKTIAQRDVIFWSSEFAVIVALKTVSATRVHTV